MCQAAIVLLLVEIFLICRLLHFEWSAACRHMKSGLCAFHTFATIGTFPKLYALNVQTQCIHSFRKARRLCMSLSYLLVNSFPERVKVGVRSVLDRHFHPAARSSWSQTSAGLRFHLLDGHYYFSRRMWHFIPVFFLHPAGDG